ncbi:glycosyltransferase [Candidatus Babeliales bacterium]|nr:glycosyltransferase [Candidatus Babeliales bacterium]
MKEVSTREISVVLGTYNRKNFLKLTINNIRQELTRLNKPTEIIVIDGGSTDGTIRWLAKQKDIITIVQHNRGSWNGKPLERRSWGYFMNLGFKCAQGKYICMLSDDCLLVPNSLRNGYELIEEKRNSGEKLGALAFYWREWPKDKRYHVGVTIGNNVFVNHGIYLNKALQEVGYIDEETYSFYFADGDLCLKLKEAGYETIVSPNSYVEHYPHANQKLRAKNLSYVEKDQQAYFSRWKNNKNICSPLINFAGIKPHNDQHKTGSLFKQVERKEPRIMINKVKSWCKKKIKSQLGWQ